MEIDTHKMVMLFLLAMLLFSCGCVSQNQTPREKIKVATTVAPLGDFVKAVGGDKIEVSVLIPPGAEPHTFEPTPSQMKEVADANLYVMNGAGLEFWMDKVLQVNKKMVVVDSSNGISLLFEDGGEADMHIWLSPRNAAVQVQNICQGLIQVDPVNCDYYLSNQEDYLQKINALDQRLDDTFAAKERKIFIVHHPAWTYFARDYDLMQVPLMKDEKEPGPKYLAEVIDLARENNISAIFVEPEYNPKAAEIISRELNASVVYLDPLAGDYLNNMAHVGEEIAKSLT